MTRLPRELELPNERRWGQGTPKSVLEPLLDFWYVSFYFVKIVLACRKKSGVGSAKTCVAVLRWKDYDSYENQDLPLHDLTSIVMDPPHLENN